MGSSRAVCWLRWGLRSFTCCEKDEGGRSFSTFPPTPYFLIDTFIYFCWLRSLREGAWVRCVLVVVCLVFDSIDSSLTTSYGTKSKKRGFRDAGSLFAHRPWDVDGYLLPVLPGC